jgi:hypothetical protein
LLTQIETKGPRGTGQEKTLKLRSGATRRQVQDGWSPACKRVQYTGLKALFRMGLKSKKIMTLILLVNEETSCVHYSRP